MPWLPWKRTLKCEAPGCEKQGNRIRPNGALCCLEHSVAWPRPVSGTKYWIVIGARPAIHPYKHSTYANAHDEAQRLALKNPGQAFTVLEALEVVKAQDVVTHILKPAPDGQEMPF